MSIVITLLTVFLVMVSLLLILVTLMQRPKQEGLGAAFGGGMMDGAFGAQTSDVLQKGTVWLTVAFFGSAILLTTLNTRLYKSQRDVGNILEDVQKPEALPSFPGLGAPPATDAKAPALKADEPKAGAKPKADKDAKPAAKTSEPTKSASKTPAAKADAEKEKPKSTEAKGKTAKTAPKADPAKPVADEKDNK